MIMGIKKLSNVFLFPSLFSSNTSCFMIWWQLTVLSVCLYAEPTMVCLFFLLYFTSVVILIVLHWLYYYVQFPAFLWSAFQTKPDSRHFSASVLGQTQLQSPCFGTPPEPARLGKCSLRERKRETLC